RAAQCARPLEGSQRIVQLAGLGERNSKCRMRRGLGRRNTNGLARSSERIIDPRKFSERGRSRCMRAPIVGKAGAELLRIGKRVRVAAGGNQNVVACIERVPIFWFDL